MNKIKINDLSDLTQQEAEQLIGKTIERIEASENELILHFADNTSLEVKGHTYEDSPLFVNFDDGEEKPVINKRKNVAIQQAQKQTRHFFRLPSVGLSAWANHKEEKQ